MPDQASRAYYAARLEHERRRAEQTTNPAIRVAHTTLADAYQRMLDEDHFPSSGRMPLDAQRMPTR